MKNLIAFAAVSIMSLISVESKASCVFVPLSDSLGAYTAILQNLETSEEVMEIQSIRYNSSNATATAFLKNTESNTIIRRNFKIVTKEDLRPNGGCSITTAEDVN